MDRTSLTPLVRRLLENEAAAVLNWHAQPVAGGFGHAYRIERVQGEAQVGAATAPWSLILKVIGPATGSLEPTTKGDHEIR